MASYYFARHAKQDLTRIVDHTLEQWGHTQAEKYINGLEQQCQTLADNPNMGTQRHSLMEGLMSFPYESHTLFYLQQADGIVIVRVLHQRMEPELQFS